MALLDNTSRIPGIGFLMRRDALKRRVFLSAVALAAFVLFTRIVYHLPFLYSWDGVQYALSISDFDIHKHQPQPPGNPLYSLSIWFATLVTHDPNKAMSVLNVLATLAATGLTGATAWLAGKTFTDSKRAWIAIGAAAIFCSNPVLWFYGCVGEIYTIEGFFVSLFMFLAMQSLDNPRWLPAVSIAMGLAGGFRPSTELFLLPAYMVLLFWQRQFIIRSLLCLIGFNLVWLLPLIQMSGGFADYASALLNHGRRLGVELPNSESAPERIGLLVIQGITAPALFFLAIRFLRLRLWRIDVLLLAVILPLFVFILFVHFPKEGYLLFLIAPLSALVAGMIARLYSRESAVAGILTAAFLANCYIFAEPPVYTFDEVANEPLKRLHYEFTSPNRRTLRDYRVRMEQFMDHVAQFKQGQRAIVIEKGQFPNWRLIMYYFPSDVSILVMDNKRLYAARDHKFIETRGEIELDERVKVLLIASAEQPDLPGNVKQFNVYQYQYYFCRTRSLPEQFRLLGIRFTRNLPKQTSPVHARNTQTRIAESSPGVDP